jgi:hypothetical protein
MDERNCYTIDEMINALQSYKEQFNGDMLIIDMNNLPIVPYFDVKYNKIRMKELK